MLEKLFNAIRKFINVDISIEIESGHSFAVSAEISLEMVKRITENEAEFVWSDFYNCLLSLDDLEFSHVDTNNVAGYRVRGTNNLVWRDQLSGVEFVTVLS